MNHNPHMHIIIILCIKWFWSIVTTGSVIKKHQKGLQYESTITLGTVYIHNITCSLCSHNFNISFSPAHIFRGHRKLWIIIHVYQIRDSLVCDFVKRFRICETVYMYHLFSQESKI